MNFDADGLRKEVVSSSHGLLVVMFFRSVCEDVYFLLNHGLHDKP